MQRGRKHVALTAISASLIMGLAACVSVLPTPETADGLYRMEPTFVKHTLRDDVLVREPEAPSIFSGSDMVSEDETGAMRLVPSVEWAGRSTRLMQLALVDSFDLESNGSAVLPEAGVIAPYELISRVRTLGFKNDKAVCELTVSLILNDSRKLVRQHDVLAAVAVRGRGNDSRALALKKASEGCVSGMAEFASETVKLHL